MDRNISLLQAVLIILVLTILGFVGYHLFTNQKVIQSESSTQSETIENGAFVSIGPQKTAAVMFTFNDNHHFDGTKKELSEALFTAPNSANAFFKTVSYGRFWLEGINDTLGGDIYHVNIPYSNTPCSPANLKQWALSAQNEAIKEGLVPNIYDYIFYFHSGSVCKSLGLPDLNPPGAIIDNFSLRAIAHEGGHAIGFSHASAYTCTGGAGRVTLSDLCEIVEYGDPFDVMGEQGTAQYNGYKRGQIGWLVNSNTQTVLTDGIYTLFPIEEKTMEVQILRIPRTVGPFGIEQFLYLEIRKPGQFENFSVSSPAVSGITLRLAGQYDKPGRSFLLDTHPETESYVDAPLMPGETFTDFETGIAVTVFSIKQNIATIKIKTGAPHVCTYHAPSGNLNIISQTPTSEGTIYLLHADITNNDSTYCPVTTMTIGNLDISSDWKEFDKMSEVNLSPLQRATHPIKLLVPASTVSGTYPISTIITNINTGLSTQITTSLPVTL